MKINENYSRLKDSYLFSEIAHRVQKFSAAHPDREILKMGIGDVTLPLAPAVVEAMRSAAEEMGRAETFRGYGPEQGYPFLREAIRDYYRSFGVAVSADEIFVSDGAKSDLGNILDLFDADNTVLIPDPVYPVYVDTNVMAGRRILFAEATEQNGFLPMPDKSVSADIIYLCSPNNPTGAAYSVGQLRQWVDYAKKCGALILYDAAYESFVAERGLARSIYEVEGAKECAIEFCSFSKTAGFTGTRCGYTVVPSDLIREGASLQKMWLRRQTTKFNGVSYIVQRGAQAAFSEEGRKQISKNLSVYRNNAAIICSALDRLHIWYTGGKNSPYVWLKCPGYADSFSFFDDLLEKTGVVGTPGSGFGKNGQGFFRLTAFAQEETVRKAMAEFERIFS
ncbi:MAG TPA: LL-diaminopimelate aminotransferase [Candidatus Borkfalkia excrementavium]|uniref:LL-diaminopimelate aminotransferase n=1 Tax=Candidatus Borkfalkia excrementavium TaxID=2838505 RepID=A0A9D2CFD5_9FIRM|nr:LL-diaminopimelate aminotransferase [Candidatus Borkfalkia excrementavium]